MKAPDFEPGVGELKVLMHVQHLLGTGHLYRTLAIARALSQRGVRVRVLSGGTPVPGIDTKGIELVQLPPAQAADASFAQLVSENGEAVDQRWRENRATQVLWHYDGFKPQVLVTETFPFGRGLLRFEIVPLLERVYATSPRPLVLCSFRDILEHRSRPEKYDQMADRVLRWFDGVLVHADPGITRFEDSFPACPRIANRIYYTGYVVNEPWESEQLFLEHPSKKMPEEAADPSCHYDVVVSAGGGRFGQTLLDTALDAATDSSARWLLLVGPQIDASTYQSLFARATSRIAVMRNRPDFQRLLRAARVSVSQAGYNTVCDVLAAGVYAILVPFSDGRQMEQPMRAATLQARGFASVISPERLSVSALREAVSTALSAPRRPAAASFQARTASGDAERLAEDEWLSHSGAPVLPMLDGAQRSAALILCLARKYAESAAGQV